jgi:hypothetical protein
MEAMSRVSVKYMSRIAWFMCWTWDHPGTELYIDNGGLAMKWTLRTQESVARRIMAAIAVPFWIIRADARLAKCA